jgi:type VI secretion system protein VasD
VSGRMIATLLVVACLFGCSSPPPPPAVLNLSILAGADQNPDPAGHPQAVAVRVFQLANPAGFQRADVFALSEREQATLGADDLGSQEYVVRPGETRAVTTQLKPGTQSVGVAVMFRDIDRAQWRQVTAVSASGPQPRTLRINGLTAALAP